MNYREFSYPALRHLALLLKTYPEYYNVIIYTTQLDCLDYFCELITKISGIKPKYRTKTYSVFENNKVKIMVRLDTKYSRGTRANCIVFDENINFSTVAEQFYPMCISEPCLIYGYMDIDKKKDKAHSIMKN